MLKFIKAHTSDIETLQILARKIWTTSYREMLSSEQIEYMLNWMYSTETITKEIENGVIWELIEMEEKPIGYIALTPEDKELKLNKLYILPDMQGKGFGQMALQHVIDYTKNNNYQTLYLTVNQRNHKAIKAYEKAGFTRKEFKIFDIGNGFIMDDYIYELRIKE